MNEAVVHTPNGALDKTDLADHVRQAITQTVTIDRRTAAAPTADVTSENLATLPLPTVLSRVGPAQG